MVKLTIIPVLLLVVANESLSTTITPTPTSNSRSQHSTSQPCSPAVMASTLSPAAPSPPVLAIINVSAEAGSCQGALHLIFNISDKGPLCHTSREKLTIFKDMLCAQLGCDKFKAWKRSQTRMGYEIAENGFIQNNTCYTLGIMCQALPKSNELVGYKTVTGLLITVILVLLLLRVGQKRCTFLYNKLFKRRNREWIGPTQSQSVSFYRAQAGTHPNSSSARYSYPALERLSVQPGREPSSNRNSDCDSYN